MTDGTHVSCGETDRTLGVHAAARRRERGVFLCLPPHDFLSFVRAHLPRALGYSAADMLPWNSPTALHILHVFKDFAYDMGCRLELSSRVLKTSQAALE
jgi:hypothetical protein